MTLNNCFFRMVALTAVFAPGTFAQTNVKARFLTFEEAGPVLQIHGTNLPGSLKSVGSLNEAKWNAWVTQEDVDIRKRLERGEEDTLTNLLRFGVTYTKEYRIDREYLARFGQSALVNSFAEKRASDLIKALNSPAPNEAMQEMKSFLERKGYSFRTTMDREKIKKYLLANLARMRDEFLAYNETIKQGGRDESSALYSERGISLDTNLWPDHEIDETLEILVKKGALKPGSIRRIGIVGPGLDFANKEFGNDYYPPQTIQPFAVIDSLIRLGLTDPNNFELLTLDISPSVNIHVARANKAAQSGKPYTLQLVWTTAVPRDQTYLDQFTNYWKQLGSQIGTQVAPIPIPQATANELHTRAVKVRPGIVAKVRPADLNIVFQRLPLGANGKFDLIIGTNVFVYYDAFEQSLARANVSEMLRPGGYLITNEFLSDAAPLKLPEVQRTKIVFSSQPMIQDFVYCYRRD